MTKAELAKKKGLKAKDAPKNAAEALITINTPETIEKEEASIEKEDRPEEKIDQNENVAVRQKNEENTEPKKKGRPKKDPKKHCTIYLGLDIVDQLDIPLAVTGKNLSEYLESLVREDIKQRGSIYNDIYAQMRKVL